MRRAAAAAALARGAGGRVEASRGEPRAPDQNNEAASDRGTHGRERGAYRGWANLGRRVLRGLVLRQPLVLQHVHQRRLAGVVQALGDTTRGTTGSVQAGGGGTGPLAVPNIAKRKT